MKTNEEAIDLIKEHEALRLKAYKCPAEQWTIGYGHTQTTTEDMDISLREANALLQKDIEEAERVIFSLIDVSKLNENQFSALVSFVFNIGGTKFSRSQLCCLVNQGKFDQAAEEFSKWVWVSLRNDGKKRLKGLVIRREKEKKLFLKQTKGDSEK